MLTNAYNQVVHFVLAASPDEVEQVVARLPPAVANGLAAELDVCEEAHRYDAEVERAYYFRQQGTGLAVWSWNEIHSFKEAGELLSLLLTSYVPLNENQANKLFSRATGRTVENPRAASDTS